MSEVLTYSNSIHNNESVYHPLLDGPLKFSQNYLLNWVCKKIVLTKNVHQIMKALNYWYVILDPGSKSPNIALRVKMHPREVMTFRHVY